MSLTLPPWATLLLTKTIPLLTRLRAKLALPTGVTVLASVAMGVLAYFNQQGTFSIDEPWHTMFTVGLAALAGMGIAPIAHGALGTILKIPYTTALAISSGFATASVALATVDINVNVRSVLVGVLTVLSGSLVGPKALPVPPPPPPPSPPPSPPLASV